MPSGIHSGHRKNKQNGKKTSTVSPPRTVLENKAQNIFPFFPQRQKKHMLRNDAAVAIKQDRELNRVYKKQGNEKFYMFLLVFLYYFDFSISCFRRKYICHRKAYSSRHLFFFLFLRKHNLQHKKKKYDL